MQEGRFIQQAVEVLPLAQLESILGAEQPHHRVGSQGYVADPEQELRAVTGGQHDDFFDAFRP